MDGGVGEALWPGAAHGRGGVSTRGEWGEALPLELSRSKSFGCSTAFFLDEKLLEKQFQIGPIETLAEDGYNYYST